MIIITTLIIQQKPVMESNGRLRMMMKRTKKHHRCCWPLNWYSHLNSCTSTSSRKWSRSWTQRNWKQELDSEDPFITPSASIAIDEGTEDMEMEERPVDVRERGRNLRGCFKMDVVSVSASYSSVRNFWEWVGICRSWVKTNLKWQWWVSSCLPLVIMTGHKLQAQG